MVMHKFKLIYNPHAGDKRRIISNLTARPITLEEIKQLLNQYQVKADFFPTRGPGHATKLAQAAQQEGYQTVIVAGGDGTVGETISGLIGSGVNLGIIPLGSFMNVARMLAIPPDIEKAIEIIKIGRTRKIDVGAVTILGGKKLINPHYFIESAGLGLQAQLYQNFLEIERGHKAGLLKIFKTIFDYYKHRVRIVMDQQQIETRASLVTISNGPFGGAALKIAPKAKLNDHRLTISLFRMSKFELVQYFLRVISLCKTSHPKITTYQSKIVSIESKTPRLVHLDARIYGHTPVEFSIVPNALRVIMGFPKAGDSALVKRTYLQA